MEGLEKLEVAPELAEKLKHIKAVATFYKGECRDLKTFQTFLDEIVGEMPDDGQAIELKDSCCLVAHFNKAIVLFHVSKPMKALKILLALLHHIDEVDEDVTRKMCLLTASILLNSNQPKKAEAVLNLMANRLNTSLESLIAEDEFEDSDLMLDKETAPRPLKGLDEFRWMLRYNMMRCKVLSQETVVVPKEEVCFL